MNVVFHIFLVACAGLGTLFVTKLYLPIFHYFLSKKSSYRNRPIGLVIVIFFLSMIGGMFYYALFGSP